MKGFKMFEDLKYVGFASDPKQTKVFEDMFCIHRDNHTLPQTLISVCATAVSFEDKNELMERATPQSDSSVDIRPSLTLDEIKSHSLTHNAYRKALCVTFDTVSRDPISIALSGAKIYQHLSCGWSTSASVIHPGSLLHSVVSFSKGLTRSRHISISPDEQIVYSLLQKFNFACSYYLGSQDIPFVSRTNNRYFVAERGIPIGVFNKPLRDRAAFLNSAQMSHFLIHDEMLFTAQDLYEMVNHMNSVH